MINESTSLWKPYIRDYLVNEFLDKVFEKCGNSVFEMEQCLKDFSFGDINVRNNLQIEEYESIVSELEDKIEEHEHTIDKLEYKIEEEKMLKMSLKFKLDLAIEKNKFLIKKIENLKKNSIVFSIDYEEDDDI